MRRILKKRLFGILGRKDLCVLKYRHSENRRSYRLFKSLLLGGIETTDRLGYFVGNLPDEKLGLFLI